VSSLDLYLLRAYLDGDLDSEQSEAFEILLIGRPDLAELVDADSALGFGLAAAQAPATAPINAPTPSEASAASSVVTPLPRRRAASATLVPLAAAASLALLAGLFVGRLTGSAGEPMQSATLVYVDKLRDVSTAPALALPASGAIVLLAPVASSAACVATVELRQEGMPALAARAQSDAFGYVSLVVARDAVRSGPAVVEVGCDGSIRARYDVRFVADGDAG
jgi:hypothetical protein